MLPIFGFVWLRGYWFGGLVPTGNVSFVWKYSAAFREAKRHSSKTADLVSCLGSQERGLGLKMHSINSQLVFLPLSKLRCSLSNPSLPSARGVSIKIWRGYLSGSQMCCRDSQVSHTTSSSWLIRPRSHWMCCGAQFGNPWVISLKKTVISNYQPSGYEYFHLFSTWIRERHGLLFIQSYTSDVLLHCHGNVCTAVGLIQD